MSAGAAIVCDDNFVGIADVAALPQGTQRMRATVLAHIHSLAPDQARKTATNLSGLAMSLNGLVAHYQL